jgi:hypothetical protein
MGMALPASVLEAKDMGRERRVRGFYLVTPSTGERVEGGRHQTAIVAASGAREELCSDREKEGRKLGRVEEGTGVLTTASIR